MKNPVRRDGLGYRWDIQRDGLTLKADRIHETGDTLTAEVVVERAPEGHLIRGRINLLAPQTRASFAKQLAALPGGKGQGVEWQETLERFFDGVLLLEREGPPFERIGTRALRPEPPYLIRPMVYVGKPTILFGEGGVGKSSTVAAAIAVSVQSGVPVLDCWNVVQRGDVLVLDWEGDGDDWNDATSRVCAGIGIEPIELHYRRMRGALDADVHRIAAYCDENDIALVIVDSVTWATREAGRGPTDEPVKRMFDALRIIGRASLLIDHKSKAAIADDQTTGASPIGSIVKVNAARATFELRKADDTDADGTRHLALINWKQNPTALQPPVGIATRHVGGRTSLWTEPVRLNDTHVAREVNASGVLWQRIREVLLARGHMSGPTLVGHLGLGGKDPLRQVETAMTRKSSVFGTTGTDRNTRTWYLHEARAAFEDRTPPPPPEPTPSVSDRMASIFATADWTEELQ